MDWSKTWFKGLLSPKIIFAKIKNNLKIISSTENSKYYYKYKT
jgi:hypothetical protein